MSTPVWILLTVGVLLQVVLVFFVASWWRTTRRIRVAEAVRDVCDAPICVGDVLTVPYVTERQWLNQHGDVLTSAADVAAGYVIPISVFADADAVYDVSQVVIVYPTVVQPGDVVRVEAHLDDGLQVAWLVADRFRQSSPG